MTAPDDDLARLPSLLETRWLGRTLRHLASCGSTNTEAQAWARAGAAAGAVVVADAQTAGRGRLGRTWHSPPGESLYLSVVLRPRLPPHLCPPLTLVAAVALGEAVESCGVRAWLKWPNDLLLDEPGAEPGRAPRKAGGILTEMTTASSRVDFVVCGVGVNLHARSFEGELAGRATSVARALGAEAGVEDGRVGRARFAAALCRSLEAWHDRYVREGAAPVVAAWKRRAHRLGETVTVRSGAETITGVAEDLDPDGTLVLRLEGGARHRVLAGELS